MIRLDPEANAALASAVASAKQGRPATESAKLESTAVAAAIGRSPLSHLPRALAALALVGSCWLASYAGTRGHQDALRQAGLEAARSHEALTRMSGDLEALRTELATLTEKADALGRRAEAPKTDLSGQAKLAERIDALAAGLRNPDVKSSALEARIEQMESQIMAALAGIAARPAAATSAPAVTEAAVREPAATAAIKPIRNEPVEGWILREVYNGAALVENPNRRLYEVVPGGVVPGVGRVEAIERRGNRWVVLTDRGVIGTYR